MKLLELYMVLHPNTFFPQFIRLHKFLNPETNQFQLLEICIVGEILSYWAVLAMTVSRIWRKNYWESHHILYFWRLATKSSFCSALLTTSSDSFLWSDKGQSYFRIKSNIRNENRTKLSESLQSAWSVKNVYHLSHNIP